MKLKKIFSIAMFSCVCLPSLLLAAAPNILTYQGRLKESGQPASGNRVVQIRLCADSGGVSCFDTIPVTQSVSVANGLFRSTFTVPSTVDLTTGIWYLELAVAGNTYLPREQFTSSPYALYASSASALVPSAVLQMGNYGVNTSSDMSADSYQINGNTVLALPNGGFDLAIGVDAGIMDNDTNGNIFVGNSAGGNTTSGTGNIFMGQQAGYTNTTGSDNTVVGYLAGFLTTIGNGNTFIGGRAGSRNTTGASNSFLGNSAGYSNNSGLNNSFVGAGAGYFNTTGGNNTCLGIDACAYSQAGSANVVLGSGAGYAGVDENNSFSSSTLVGFQAGYSFKTGAAGNILLGYRAGANITTGAGNIVIGYAKDTSAPGASNELNIGGAIYGDLTSGNVGIGTASPGSKLEVNGDVKVAGTTLMGLNYKVYEVGTDTASFRVGCGANYNAIGGSCFTSDPLVDDTFDSYPSTESDDAPSAGTPVSSGATAANSWTCRFGGATKPHKVSAICARIGN